MPFLKINKKRIFLVLEIFLVFFIAIYGYIRYTNYVKKYMNIENFINFVIVLIIFAVISIGIFLLKNNSIEKCFLFIYFVLGIIYMIILPFLRVHDEGAHFIRAYEISQGYLLTESTEYGVGRELPKEIAEIEYGNIKVSMKNIMDDFKMELSDKVFIPFPTSAIVAPTNYIPQAIGIKIANLFTKKLVLIAYVGRLLNFLTTMLIFWIAIKYIPYGKKVILLLALLPRNLHEAISLAPDGIITAVFCAFVAFVYYLRYEYSGKMKWKHYLCLYLFVVFISLCKFVYVPLLILLFLIPINRFNKTKYFFMVVSGIVLMCILCFGWAYICNLYGLNFGNSVDAEKQVQYILHNPFKFIEILFRTITIRWNWYIQTMLGNWLGWLNIGMNEKIISISGWILIYNTGKMIFKFERRKIQLSIILAVFISIVLIFTSLYITCTEVENTIVRGVQGRYFMPLLAPLLFSIVPKGKYINDEGSCCDYSILLMYTINMYIIIKLLFVCYR